jgi:hypothetical protein
MKSIRDSIITSSHGPDDVIITWTDVLGMIADLREAIIDCTKGKMKLSGVMIVATIATTPAQAQQCFIPPLIARGNRPCG